MIEEVASAVIFVADTEYSKGLLSGAVAALVGVSIGVFVLSLVCDWEQRQVQATGSADQLPNFPF